MRFKNYFLLLTLLLVINSSVSYSQKVYINDTTKVDTIRPLAYNDSIFSNSSLNQQPCGKPTKYKMIKTFSNRCKHRSIKPTGGNHYTLRMNILQSLFLVLLVLSIGLGVITKQYYQKKNINQQLYINQLKETEKIQVDFTKKLEREISLRTKELQKEKEFAEQKNHENELLLKEIHHRVKNNMQIVSSLLSLQERNITDPFTKELLLEGKQRIESMILIQKMLFNHSAFLEVNMCDFINKLADKLFYSYGIKEKKIIKIINCSNINLNTDTAIPVGLILNELIINTLKYAFANVDKPTLKIDLIEDDNELILRVSDNGNGKISNLENSTSFGMKLITLLSRQINGKLLIKENNGLSIELRINDYKLIDGN